VQLVQQLPLVWQGLLLLLLVLVVVQQQGLLLLLLMLVAVVVHPRRQPSRCATSIAAASAVQGQQCRQQLRNLLPSLQTCQLGMHVGAWVPARS
jgi:hypothetical protein